MNGDAKTAIVIGAGVAGLTAAAALARKGVATTMVDDGYLGGLVANVGHIDGVAPFEGQSGADLASALLGEALEAGVEYAMGETATLSLTPEGWMADNAEAPARFAVLATGARLRRLGVPGEERLTGLGVSQCAYCDGGLYRGQPVAVVGGGDAAFQEALHLAEIGCATTLLIRGAAPRARAAYVAAAKAAPSLALRFNVDVLEILGETGVDALRLNGRADGEENLPVRAVFPFVGLTPNTALAPAGAERDATGAIKVDAAMQTGAADLFAIGAARAGFDGSLTTAAADAETAATAIANR